MSEMSQTKSLTWENLHGSKCTPVLQCRWAMLECLEFQRAPLPACFRESTCQTGTAVVGCELKAAHLERTQLRAVPPRAEREREERSRRGGGKSGILHHAPVLRSGLERRRRRKRTLRWTFALPARTRGRGGMEANGGTHGELDGARIYNPVALGVHPRTTPPPTAGLPIGGSWDIKGLGTAF